MYNKIDRVVKWVVYGSGLAVFASGIGYALIDTNAIVGVFSFIGALCFGKGIRTLIETR